MDLEGMEPDQHFNGTAKPIERKILWIIPGTGPLLLYGYSQVPPTRKVEAVYEKDRAGVHFRYLL